jgi:hypothetical protein
VGRRRCHRRAVAVVVAVIGVVVTDADTASAPYGAATRWYDGTWRWVLVLVTDEGGSSSPSCPPPQRARAGPTKKDEEKTKRRYA